MHFPRSLSITALTLAVAASGMSFAQAATASAQAASAHPTTTQTATSQTAATQTADQPAATHTAASFPRTDAVTLPAQNLAHFSHLLNEQRQLADANSTSTNWSGYAANTGTYTTVTSSWVEPSVSCTADGIVAFWIGLDGWGSDSVEQDGTGVDCSGGSPQAFAWWETYPADSIQEYNNPVAAGDSLTSTVTSESNGRYDLVLTDSTRGWTENNVVAKPSGASNASAEIIAEAVSNGSSVTPLPNFGAVHFTGSTIDNGTLQAVGAQGIDMTNGNGTVIATTGPADSSGDFTVSYGSGTTTGNTVTVNSPGNQSSAVGAKVGLQISGTDSGGASLSYTATGLPTGASISKTGLISGTVSTAGSYSVTVTAKDSTGASGSTSFTWTVGSSTPPPPPSCNGIPAWSSTTPYVPGDQVSYNGYKYTSSWYSTGAVPGAASSWAVWASNGAC